MASPVQHYTNTDTEPTLALMRRIRIEPDPDDLLVALDRPPQFALERFLPENVERFSTDKVQRLKCRLCSKRYRQIENLRKHLAAEHSTNKIASKREVYNYKDASKIKGKSNPLVCPECGKLCSQRNHLTNHMKGHEKIRREALRLKEAKTFKYKYYDMKTGRYKCDQCEVSYVLQQHLTMHLNRHKKSKHAITNSSQVNPQNQPFLGSTDDALPRETYDRSTDKYWNASLNLYECDQCDKTCLMRNHLTNHLKGHATMAKSSSSSDVADAQVEEDKYWNESLRAFECDQCEKTFAHRFVLNLHLKSHVNLNSSPKTDTNVECPKATDISQDDPKVNHDIEDYWNLALGLYECNLCWKTFKLPRQIIAHKKKHKVSYRGTFEYLHKYWNDTRKCFDCDQCDKVYISCKPMAKHLRIHKLKLQKKKQISRKASKDIEMVFLDELSTDGEYDTYESDDAIAKTKNGSGVRAKHTFCENQEDPFDANQPSSSSSFDQPIKHAPDSSTTNDEHSLSMNDLFTPSIELFEPQHFKSADFCFEPKSTTQLYSKHTILDTDSLQMDIRVVSDSNQNETSMDHSSTTIETHHLCNECGRTDDQLEENQISECSSCTIKVGKHLLKIPSSVTLGFHEA